MGLSTISSPRYGLGDVTTESCLRVFAAASIVLFHTGPHGWLGSTLGGIALGVFLYLSFHRLTQDRNIRITLKRRAKQLLIPWMAWWLFYAPIALWRHGVPRLDLTNPILAILEWPSIHLWYLPFVFIATVGVCLVRTITAPIPRQLKAVMSLVVALVVLVLLQVFVPKGPSLVYQMALAIPTIGLGITYGYCLRVEDRRQRLVYLVAIAALVAVFCGPSWLWGNYRVAIAYAGSSLMMVFFTFRMPNSRLLRRFAALTLGIYLVHPFAALLLLKLPEIRDLHGHWSLAFLTFVASMLMTWGIRQIIRNGRRQFEVVGQFLKSAV